MEKRTSGTFELSATDTELIRTKLFPSDSDRDWELMEPGIKDALSFLKNLFIASKLQAGLKIDCYGYWPLNSELTRWRASDGSILERSFVDLLSNMGTPDDMGQMLQMEFEDIEQDFIIPKRMGQAEFEDTYM